MMLSNIHYSIVLVALAAGCSLDDGAKTSCNVLQDCLDGYHCIDQTCVPAGGSNGSPDARGTFYGSVEPLVAQSNGVTASNYQTLVGVTTAGGNLGCSVVGDLTASPGADVAVVYAKVSAQSGDARCPMGTFAIMNDPSACAPSWTDELRPGCALYKRWDAGGKQVAYQLAIGGYVSVQRTYLNDMAYRCTAEVSIRFAGGATIAKTFQFDYNPLGPSETFCLH